MKPWRAPHPPALAVTAGQRILAGRLDNEHPGGPWAVDATGLGGWIPAGILKGHRIPPRSTRSS
jgi:hypothetical protein